MKKFLEIVAENLYEKFGTDMSNVVVVFPNRRAELFFNGYLFSAAKKTLWAPTYTTISDLFQRTSNRQILDPTTLISELYNVYKNITKTTETFDDFFFWGEMLLNDFDDIDKNLANATQLFSNLKELRAYKDSFEFLDDSQRKALEQFFTNFSLEKQSDLKQKFTNVWNVLGEIYTKFKEKLEAENFAYEGMLYRKIIENIEQNDNNLFADKTYAFVGFNVLSACEKQLFKYLMHAERALFYWDYDEYYIADLQNEAGTFMRENLKNFPPAISGEKFDNFLKSNPKIKIISSSSESAQARYLPNWISNIANANDIENANSAVVLCNESLLLGTLHSLPENINDVNVTMGFPLSQTPVFGLINVLLDLQIKGYDEKHKAYYRKNILDVLQNQYVQKIAVEAKKVQTEISQNHHYQYPIEKLLNSDAVLQLIFAPVENAEKCTKYLLSILDKVVESINHENYDELYNEAIFRSYTTINRLSDLLLQGNLSMELRTFARLLRRLLFATNVPFHGEPVKGLQIMGVLETRNLDFKNILLLSANEGLMPKTGKEASFIPFNLRRAFGLTTIEHRNSIYAYYFYRLLQRAENISILYNAASSGLNTGEMSRFVLQLIVESGLNIELCDIQSQINIPKTEEISVAKAPEMLEFLHKKYTQKYLSPSVLNGFIDCPLRFYFKNVANLRRPDNSNDIPSTFGRIFHDAADVVYRHINKFNNIEIEAADLEKILNDENLIYLCVDEAFTNTFAKNSKEKITYNGYQLIMREVVATYLKRLLNIDKQYAPFTMYKSEMDVSQSFKFDTSIGNIDLQIGGRIDRIDKKNEVIRISDYKTGAKKSLPIADMKSLFESSENRDYYAFQVMLYSTIVATKREKISIKPALIYVQKLSKTDDTLIKIGAGKQKTIVENVQPFVSEFIENMNNLIYDMFDISQPFSQTNNVQLCQNCDFKEICKR